MTRYLILLNIIVVCSTAIFTQQKSSEAQSQGTTVFGQYGVSRTTSEIMAAEEKLRPEQAPPFRRALEFEVDREHLPQNPESPDAPPTTFEQIQRWIKTGQQRTPFSPQTLSTSFTGATLSGVNPTFSFPPDAMGTIGPTQYIVAVNGRIVTFDKTTGSADGVLNTTMDNFFSSVMTPPLSSNFTSDPRIRYDRLSGKWMVIIIDVPGDSAKKPNRVLLAVSNTSTITGGTIWTDFFFQQDTINFADYPTLGVDANALYIGANIFDSSGSFVNTTAFVVQKSSVLGAGPIVVTAFRNLINTITHIGPYTPQGVDNFDASASQGYFIGVDNATFGTLILRRVSNPGGTPTLSANISLTVSATSFPSTVQHLGNTGGTNGKLDAIDDRLFAAAIRNGNLWTAHNIKVSNTGSASGTTTRDASRWYEIQNLGTTPSLAQSGTVFDPTSPNDVNQRNYFIPTLMVSGQGHAAMGFTTAGTSERANAATVGRLASDASGIMETPILYTSSSTAYNPPSDPGGSHGRRWGDYSYTSLDPNDDMTLWTIVEFCNATNSYGVRVVKLLAPPPSKPSGASPSTVNMGSTNVNVVITGTSSSGSGFFDPGPGFANHISASIGGSGVTVNSTTYTDPTHVTLNIDVASNAPAGNRTLTIINPDGQSSSSVSGILTITNPACPTITITPPTLPNGTVGTFYNQTISASGGVSPYVFSVIFGTLPTGLSLSSAGTLSGTPTSSGASSFTIEATDSNSCIADQSYSVTINPGSNTISLTSLGTAYTQDFSTLSNSGTSGTLPPGWLFNESGTNANSTYSAGDGSNNAGDTYSFGSTGSSERAFGMLQSGSLVPMIGAGFTNNTGSTVTSLAISYTGEQWRLGTTGRADHIDFQMSMNATSLTTGIYADYNNLDFSSPTTTGSTGSLDGNSAGNRTNISFTITGVSIPNGTTFFIRWTDLDVSGADDGLAVDDFSLTPSISTSPAGSGIASPATITRGDTTLCKVTVSPGTNPTSTGITVTGNLSSIGGSGTQTFFDDGTHGDSIAGDNIFSFLATISPNTSPGPKSFPVGIADAQSRTDSTSISLTVACTTISLSPNNLPEDSVGTAFSQTVTSSGGIPPYSFAVTSGSLPNGLTISSSGMISGTPTTAETVSVTITATDSTGCSGSKSYVITINPSSQIVVSVSINANWNMLSNPVAVTNDSVVVLFPDAVSNAFAYDPGLGYSVSKRLTNGNGYWLKFNNAHIASLVGRRIIDDTIDVTAGWNLTGSVSQNIPTSSIMGLGTTLNAVYGFNGAYQISDSIIAGKAYWLNVSSNGKCVLTSGSSGNHATQSAIHAGDLNVLNKLIFTDAVGNNQTLYFGATVGNMSPERFLLPPLPPNGVFDVRYISQRIAEFAESGAQKDIPIVVSAANYPLNIAWTSSTADNGSKLLVDGRAFSLTGEGATQITHSSSQIKLRIAPSWREIFPKEFALFQNYPNPFNPTTDFRYRIADFSHVTLKILDVLGREIATVVNEPQVPGEYEASWDAGKFPSGVYYYKLTAGTFSDVKKMVLIR